MLNVNSNAARLALDLERVLIVDPYPGSAKLACDMVRGMGALRIELVEESRQAYDKLESYEPQVILTELTGPEVDGVTFLKNLRKSHLGCRKAPVIVISAEATEQTIKAARDAGAHEFLRKPFSANDLFRRVENVVTKTRPWIEAVNYIGPCRRRFNSGNYAGPKRRTTDNASAADATYLGQVDQALRILKSAIVHFGDDPLQAVRSIQAQTEILARLADSTKNPRMRYVVQTLTGRVEGAARRGMKPVMPSDDVFDEVIKAAAAMDGHSA